MYKRLSILSMALAIGCSSAVNAGEFFRTVRSGASNLRKRAIEFSNDHPVAASVTTSVTLVATAAGLVRVYRAYRVNPRVLKVQEEEKKEIEQLKALVEKLKAQHGEDKQASELQELKERLTWAEGEFTCLKNIAENFRKNAESNADAAQQYREQNLQLSANVASLQQKVARLTGVDALNTLFEASPPLSPAQGSSQFPRNSPPHVHEAEMETKSAAHDLVVMQAPTDGSPCEPHTPSLIRPQEYRRLQGTEIDARLRELEEDLNGMRDFVGADSPYLAQQLSSDSEGSANGTEVTVGNAEVRPERRPKNLVELMQRFERKVADFKSRLDALGKIAGHATHTRSRSNSLPNLTAVLDESSVLSQMNSLGQANPILMDRIAQRAATTSRKGQQSLLDGFQDAEIKHKTAYAESHNGDGAVEQSQTQPNSPAKPVSPTNTPDSNNGGEQPGNASPEQTQLLLPSTSLSLVNQQLADLTAQMTTLKLHLAPLLPEDSGAKRLAEIQLRELLPDSPVAKTRIGQFMVWGNELDKWVEVRGKQMDALQAKIAALELLVTARNAESDQQEKPKMDLEAANLKTLDFMLQQSVDRLIEIIEDEEYRPSPIIEVDATYAGEKYGAILKKMQEVLGKITASAGREQLAQNKKDLLFQQATSLEQYIDGLRGFIEAAPWRNDLATYKQQSQRLIGLCCPSEQDLKARVRFSMRSQLAPALKKPKNSADAQVANGEQPAPSAHEIRHRRLASWGKKGGTMDVARHIHDTPEPDADDDVSSDEPEEVTQGDASSTSAQLSSAQEEASENQPKDKKFNLEPVDKLKEEGWLVPPSPADGGDQSGHDAAAQTGNQSYHGPIAPIQEEAGVTDEDVLKVFEAESQAAQASAGPSQQKQHEATEALVPLGAANAQPPVDATSKRREQLIDKARSPKTPPLRTLAIHPEQPEPSREDTPPQSASTASPGDAGSPAEKDNHFDGVPLAEAGQKEALAIATQATLGQPVLIVANANPPAERQAAQSSSAGESDSGVMHKRTDLTLPIPAEDRAKNVVRRQGSNDNFGNLSL